jgi:malate dehydrogenase
MGKTVKVVVTGASGQVAYALLPRIASGGMFGPDTEVDLRLWDIPPMIDKAKGVIMELEDGAYPLLARVMASADRAETHADVDWALLVGSVPRGPGMERGDLIRKNGPIFVEEGRAIAQHASKDVRVVVVGNPCNTNCLIAREAAGPSIPDDRWTALTRLDQNRARSLLAAKAGARVRDVKKLAIWGNHSATLYPDFTNAVVGGRKAAVAVDRAWLEGEFITLVQQRGAAIIAARGASSAFSAAQAVVDHVRSLISPTPADDWASVAVVSDGSYGVPKGLVSSFPVRVAGDGWWEIVQGVELDAFARSKIDATVAELVKERDVVQDLIAGAAAR